MDTENDKLMRALDQSAQKAIKIDMALKEGLALLLKFEERALAGEDVEALIGEVDSLMAAVDEAIKQWWAINKLGVKQ